MCNCPENCVDINCFCYCDNCTVPYPPDEDFDFSNDRHILLGDIFEEVRDMIMYDYIYWKNSMNGLCICANCGGEPSLRNAFRMKLRSNKQIIIRETFDRLIQMDEFNEKYQIIKKDISRQIDTDIIDLSIYTDKYILDTILNYPHSHMREIVEKEYVMGMATDDELSAEID